MAGEEVDVTSLPSDSPSTGPTTGSDSIPPPGPGPTTGPTTGGPSAPGPKAPAPKGAAPQQNKTKDTLPPEKKDKKPDEEKDKSWTAQMNALAQGYMDNMVKPFNDMLTKKMFGATGQDIMDSFLDPEKAKQVGNDMSQQISSNIKSVGQALSNAGTSISKFFSKGNTPTPEPTDDNDDTLSSDNDNTASPPQPLAKQPDSDTITADLSAVEQSESGVLQQPQVPGTDATHDVGNDLDNTGPSVNL